MFKHASIYKITPDWFTGLEQIEAQLTKGAFVDCAPTQRQSSGWIPPREANGALAESVQAQLILKLRTDSRKVPGDTLKKRVDELAAQVENETGRKPGKKHRAELKEQAELELLPLAFVKTSTTLVWIDRVNRLLVIDTASASRAEDVVSCLVKALDGFAVSLVQTQHSPTTAMTGWLHSGEPPACFTVDRECELRSLDEMKSVIRYSRLTLDTDEVKAHITSGKVARRLAMTWEGRLSFVLTDNCVLRKLAFLAVVFEGGKQEGADAFDADVAIMTGELERLIPDLIDALGGELVLEQAA